MTMSLLFMVLLKCMVLNLRRFSLRSDYRNVNRIAACLLPRCLELTVATVTMLRL